MSDEHEYGQALIEFYKIYKPEFLTNTKNVADLVKSGENAESRAAIAQILLERYGSAPEGWAKPEVKSPLKEYFPQIVLAVTCIFALLVILYHCWFYPTDVVESENEIAPKFLEFDNSEFLTVKAQDAKVHLIWIQGPRTDSSAPYLDPSRGWEDSPYSKIYVRNLQAWRQQMKPGTVKLWLKDECEELVQRHFGHMLRIYRNLFSSVMQTDLVRLMILLQYGGLYADLAARPFASSERTLHEVGFNPAVHQLVVVRALDHPREPPPLALENGFLFSHRPDQSSERKRDRASLLLNRALKLIEERIGAIHDAKQANMVNGTYAKIGGPRLIEEVVFGTHEHGIVRSDVLVVPAGVKSMMDPLDTNWMERLPQPLAPPSLFVINYAKALWRHDQVIGSIRYLKNILFETKNSPAQHHHELEATKMLIKALNFKPGSTASIFAQTKIPLKNHQAQKILDDALQNLPLKLTPRAHVAAANLFAEFSMVRVANHQYEAALSRCAEIAQKALVQNQFRVHSEHSQNGPELCYVASSYHRYLLRQQKNKKAISVLAVAGCVLDRRSL